MCVLVFAVAGTVIVRLMEMEETQLQQHADEAQCHAAHHGIYAPLCTQGQQAVGKVLLLAGAAGLGFKGICVQCPLLERH